MKMYVVNAFTNETFSGNQAGVVLMDTDVRISDKNWMQNVAKELKHSETAFISRDSEDMFRIRYFTTECEVPLCGHATIATFSLMSQEGIVVDGVYKLATNEEILEIQVENGYIWMQMAKPEKFGELSTETMTSLYEAYNLNIEKDKPNYMEPKLIKVGIGDIFLPVNNQQILMEARQDGAKVSKISKQYDGAGVHMFCLSEQKDITAYCSNYAPFLGIEEECATGTANAGLTYYLYTTGLLKENEYNEYLFVQGEHMNRKSFIKSRLIKKLNEVEIFIGGQAVIMMECKIRF